MSDGAIHIRRVAISAPVDARQAKSFAERTMRRAVEMLADDGLDAEIPAMTLRVTRAEAADPESLARRLAAEIRRRAR